MKHTISLFLLLYLQISFLFAQNQTFSGTVLISRDANPIDPFDYIAASNVDIYLLKRRGTVVNIPLKQHIDNCFYNISLSEKELKKYKYIEFVHNEQSLVYPLDSIPQKDFYVKFKSGAKPIMVEKPAIYLYPTHRDTIHIRHEFKGEILTTYPEYKENWQVVAEPNGNLLNLKDNRYYNYLFWDGKMMFDAAHFQYQSGFYVKKAETVDFLQEKLALMGVNNTEINDFIVYWLPLLNKNEQNFIHFWVNDNIDNASYLHINPKPDTEIVIFMEYQGMNSAEIKAKLPEQNLPSLERKGFTVVEWGGGEVNAHIGVE